MDGLVARDAERLRTGEQCSFDHIMLLAHPTARGYSENGNKMHKICVSVSL